MNTIAYMKPFTFTHSKTTNVLLFRASLYALSKTSDTPSSAETVLSAHPFVIKATLRASMTNITLSCITTFVFFS